jgi:hypothetical protein
MYSQSSHCGFLQQLVVNAIRSSPPQSRSSEHTQQTQTTRPRPLSLALARSAGEAIAARHAYRSRSQTETIPQTQLSPASKPAAAANRQSAPTAQPNTSTTQTKSPRSTKPPPTTQPPPQAAAQRAQPSASTPRCTRDTAHPESRAGCTRNQRTQHRAQPNTPSGVLGRAYHTVYCAGTMETGIRI